MHVVGKQACALAVMPNHLQKIAATPAKAKEMSAEWITPKHFLYLQPATTGPGSPCACRCNRLPTTPGRPSGLGSSQCLQAVHDPNKNLDVNIAIENDTSPVHAYDLHAAPPAAARPISEVTSDTTSAGTNPFTGPIPRRPSRAAFRQRFKS